MRRTSTTTRAKISRYNVGRDDRPEFRYLSLCFRFHKHSKNVSMQVVQPVRGVLRPDRTIYECQSLYFNMCKDLVDRNIPIPYYDILGNNTYSDFPNIISRNKNTKNVVVSNINKNREQLAFELAESCFADIPYPEVDGNLRQILRGAYGDEALVELTWLDYKLYGTMDVIDRRLSRFISMYNLFTAFELLEFKELGEEISGKMEDHHKAILTTKIMEELGNALGRNMETKICV